MLAAGGGLYLIVLVAYATSPETTTTGYMPQQPVPYSHELHAGQLGMDCRYCHHGVEVGGQSAHPAHADMHELP